jgi:hypothetical protein
MYSASLSDTSITDPSWKASIILGIRMMLARQSRCAVAKRKFSVTWTLAGHERLLNDCSSIVSAPLDWSSTTASFIERTGTQHGDSGAWWADVIFTTASQLSQSFSSIACLLAIFWMH